MLNDKQTLRAAETLWRCWRDGGVIENLPAGIRPENRADGYAIQSHFEAMSGRPIFGWKIAATSRAGQQHIGVDGPLAGRLLAEHVFEDGASLAFGHNRMAVAEAEFAFRLATDLPPRSSPYSTDEVLTAVGELHTAIELPDSRFEPFETAGAGQLIADNACAHDFVVGPAVPVTWRDKDLSRQAVTLTVEGKDSSDGVGANVLGDPRIALAWIANELSDFGIGLQAGQVITTGTCTTPMPIGPGDRVVADFGELGAVSMHFEPTAAC